jgi:hypothetical protein
LPCSMRRLISSNRFDQNSLCRGSGVMVEIVFGSTAVVTNRMAAVITAIVMTRVRVELRISAICVVFRTLAITEQQLVYLNLRPYVNGLLAPPEDGTEKLTPNLSEFEYKIYNIDVQAPSIFSIVQ